MDAIGARQDCNVRAVVDDQQRVRGGFRVQGSGFRRARENYLVFVDDAAEKAGASEERAVVKLFIAKLQDMNARFDKRCSALDERAFGRAAIDQHI
jgi:hypothetical protein